MSNAIIIIGLIILYIYRDKIMAMLKGITPIPTTTTTPTPTTTTTPPAVTPDPNAADCSAVFNKLPKPFIDGALKLLSPGCITLTGKVTWINPCNSDGDMNFNVLPDPEFAKYLLPGNSSDAFVKKYPASKGNIHCEISCYCENTSVDPLKKTMCHDNQVWPKLTAPKVGDRVKVTGAWIEDVREEEKAEIHPVTAVEVLPASASASAGKVIHDWNSYSNFMYMPIHSDLEFNNIVKLSNIHRY